MSHFIKSLTKESLDPETGEVTSVEIYKELLIKSKADHFSMIYFKFLSPFYNLTHATDLKLIVKLNELAEYNTGIVSLPTKTRRLICEELKLNQQNFSKYLKRLKDKGLIEGNDGVFKINPSVFWKGDAKTRDLFLKGEGLSFGVRVVSEDFNDDTK